MKKLLMATLSLAVLATACTKQDEKTQESKPETKTEVKADTPPAPASEPAKPSQEHKHDHAGHDHKHDHAHHHAPEDAVAYQCGDKTIHIALHDHDGEKEAHITTDNITYDLAEDVQSKGRYTSDDSILGDDKGGMALNVDGNKASVTTLDGKALLDCTKKS